MKSRLLVALFGVPALLLILLFLPAFATALLIALLCLVAAHELCSLVPGFKVYTLIVMIFSLAAPLCLYFKAGLPLLAALGLLLFLLLFALWVAYHEKETGFGFVHIGIGLLGGLIVPLCLSGLILLRAADNGEFRVLVPFVIAFVGDAGALFAGMLFGRHKLAPKTSPKKTREGAVGGLVCSTLFMLIFGLILRAFDVGAELGLMAALGLAGGLVSQLGDLSFSLIKREFGIKDYGKLMPGHGGVLDRFDSMVTLAPLVALAFAALAPF